MPTAAFGEPMPVNEGVATATTAAVREPAAVVAVTTPCLLA